MMLFFFFFFFCVENFDVGLHSNIYELISFKLGMMTKTTKICILLSVWMALTFIQDHSCMQMIKNLSVCFLRCFAVDLHENQYVATTVGLLKLILNLFCTSSIQGSKLCRRDFFIFFKFFLL